MKKSKCKECKGTGWVQIGPNVKGIKPCPYCSKDVGEKSMKKFLCYLMTAMAVLTLSSCDFTNETAQMNYEREVLFDKGNVAGGIQ